jgi:hypothetical protein
MRYKVTVPTYWKGRFLNPGDPLELEADEKPFKSFEPWPASDASKPDPEPPPKPFAPIAISEMAEAQRPPSAQTVQEYMRRGPKKKTT